MRKSILLVTACLVLSLSASAQNAFRGAYFMDTYLYAHTMNPALTANRSYASIGLGRIDLQTQSNLGASTFLYPQGNGVVTFLSEKVPSQTFLSKIRPNNTENVSAQVDLLNFGFWTRKDQFHSFSLNLRAIEHSAVPRDIFRFLKDGSTDGKDYDLSGISARTRAYVEAAYGISFPVAEGLRIGGKVKALVGLAYEDMRFDRFGVTLSGERWTVETDGRLQTSNLPVTQGSGPVRISEIFDISDYDWSRFRPSGFGAAVDLGATWNALPWLQLSASVTDLGFLHWKIDAPMQTQGLWEYSGFDNISYEGNDNLQGQLEAKLDELNRLLEFQRGGSAKPIDMLPATFYLGAKLQPCHWFSAGLLGTARREGKYSWAELRGSLNLEPCNWFGWSASAAYGSFGPKIASLLDLSLGPFALFVGAEMSSVYFISSEPRAKHTLSDYFEGNVYAIPRDRLNLDLSIGLNLVFGKRPAQRKAAGPALVTED